MMRWQRVISRTAVLVRGRTRRPIAFGCLGLVIIGVVITGLALTPPQVRPRLLPGSIWLTSRAVGQLTLVNGVAAQVSAAVSVTGPDGRFTTEQSATHGYAINSATGDVVAVNDATLQKSATTLSATAQLVAVSGGTVFVVNRAQRLVQILRSDTLAPVGHAVQMPGRGSAAVAVGGVLWLADGPTGSVVSFRDENDTPTKEFAPALFGATRTQPRLTAANGQPLLVDPGGRTASLLTATGAVARTMPVDLRAADLLSGSTDSDMLDSVQPDRGLLTLCDFISRACLPSFRLTGMNHRLGTAIQTDGHVFVPDYTSGVVRIVDIGNRRVVATAPIFDHAVTFELLQSDHIVYFNDPDNEQAGVIEPDGSLRRLDKYDPEHPAGTPVTSGPHTTRSGPPVPTVRPVPRGTGSALPGPATGPPAAGGTRSATTVPTAPGPHILDIVTDPATPEALLPVTFSADVTGAPTTWTWTLTRPDGTSEASEGMPRFDHVFAKPGVYGVRLVVAAGALRDEQSLRLTVIPFSPSLHCGDTITTNVVLTTDLNCDGVALTIGADDITVDLNGHTVTGSGLAVAGTAFGIVANQQSGFTIENGTVNAGLKASSGSFVTLSHLHVDQITLESTDDVRTEQSTVGGIRDEGGTNNSVVDTTVSGGSILLDGTDTAFVSGCTLSNATINLRPASINSTIVDNTLTQGTIALQQANNQSISGNTFERSNIVVHESSQIAVQGNRFTDAGTAVFVTDQGIQDLVVDGNTFDHNTIGVEVNATNVNNFSGGKITNNVFTDNGTVGVYAVIQLPDLQQPAVVSGNTFTGNGARSGGAVDPHGHPVNDGLHIDAPTGTSLVISDNHTQNDADYGIEAQPGTVIDGGGNASRGDPSGCLGVTCR